MIEQIQKEGPSIALEKQMEILDDKEESLLEEIKKRRGRLNEPIWQHQPTHEEEVNSFDELIDNHYNI